MIDVGSWYGCSWSRDSWMIMSVAGMVVVGRETAG